MAKVKMEYDDFLKVITTLKEERDKFEKINDLKIGLIDFVDPYHVVIDILMRNIYGEEAFDWFGWFCYENDFGNKDWSNVKFRMDKDGEVTDISDDEVIHPASDKDGNPICYDFRSLWEYMESL